MYDILSHLCKWDTVPNVHRMSSFTSIVSQGIAYSSSPLNSPSNPFREISIQNLEYINVHGKKRFVVKITVQSH